MNAAQIHLALNHAPLFISFSGVILLVLGLLRKNVLLKNTSLLFMFLSAIFAVAVYLTGEGAEEIVEKMAGVNESVIEKHEALAKFALASILINGAISLIGIWAKNKAHIMKLVYLASLIFSLLTIGIMAETAHLGGLIRHSEIQPGQKLIDAANQGVEGD